MHGAPAWMESGVSYAVGIVNVHVRSRGEPEVLLVLQKPGEAFAQKQGGTYARSRIWKMPIGRFDIVRDRNLNDTGKVEFWQETGRLLPALSPDLSVQFRIPSQREGSNFHEDVFFLVASGAQIPVEQNAVLDSEVERADYFPLDQLPDGRGANDCGAAISSGHIRKLGKVLLEVGHKIGLRPDLAKLVEGQLQRRSL
jgi:hypothetical protein